MKRSRHRRRCSSGREELRHISRFVKQPHKVKDALGKPNWIPPRDERPKERKKKKKTAMRHLMGTKSNRKCVWCVVGVVGVVVVGGGGGIKVFV